MVNPGHASKGCATCKMRRIRCDYGRPFCLRCTKSKRICLGYSVRNQQAKLSHEKTDYDDVALMVCPSVATCLLTGSCLLSSTSHFMAGYSSTKSYIDYSFCSIGSNYAGNGVPRLVWDNFGNVPEAGGEHLVMVVWSMLETLNEGFYSLRQSTQTIEARKDLLQKYGSATRQLREALAVWPSSSVLLIPVFHFSLYEMIVNLNPADRTWQTHLSGLLIILQRIPDNTAGYTLAKAIKISGLVTNVHEALESLAADDSERACLLLDIVKLQLRKLVAEMDAIASNSPPSLRKLDMLKLQVSIKSIRKHLDLFPIVVRDRIRSTMVPIGLDSPHSVNQTNTGAKNNFIDDLLIMQWIEFYTLQVMTSGVLLKIGGFLYQDATYHCKREFAVLNRIIQEAVEGICSITTSYIGLRSQTALSCLEMSHIKKSQALMLIWPLFCVSIATGLVERQKGWARELLWVIGKRYSIPKALSLACPSGETSTQSDILAGILLVGLSSILPNPMLI
ncbi:hypothetical protein GGI43DRAFT_422594 [Trichoderma evansii]